MHSSRQIADDVELQAIQTIPSVRELCCPLQHRRIDQAKAIVDCEIAERSFVGIQNLPENRIDQPPQYALAHSDDSEKLDEVLCFVCVATWSSAETSGLLFQIDHGLCNVA